MFVPNVGFVILINRCDFLLKCNLMFQLQNYQISAAVVNKSHSEICLSDFYGG